VGKRRTWHTTHRPTCNTFHGDTADTNQAQQGAREKSRRRRGCKRHHTYARYTGSRWDGKVEHRWVVGVMQSTERSNATGSRRSLGVVRQLQFGAQSHTSHAWFGFFGGGAVLVCRRLLSEVQFVTKGGQHTQLCVAQGQGHTVKRLGGLCRCRVVPLCRRCGVVAVHNTQHSTAQHSTAQHRVVRENAEQHVDVEHKTRTPNTHTHTHTQMRNTSANKPGHVCMRLRL